MGASPSSGNPLVITYPYGLGPANESVVLHSGAFMVSDGSGWTAPATGILRWQWLPTPRVTYDVELDGATSAALWDPASQLTVEVDDSPAAVRTRTPSVGFANASLNGFYGNKTRGDAAGMTRLVFHVPNMPWVYGDWLKSGEGQWRGRVVLRSAVWQVVLDARRDADAVSAQAAGAGGYVSIYLGELARVDGGTLTAEDADLALSALRSCLSFAFGRHISPALTAGYDSTGKIVWQDWRVFRISPWSGAETVIDPMVGWHDLGALFDGFVTLWQDSFTRALLLRAVHYYLESNDPMPLELAVASAQSGLELLAWEDLVEERKTLTKDEHKKNTAAENMQKLLETYGVDVAVPPTLSHLVAAATKLNCSNGPVILTRMRNGVTHPSRRKPVFAAEEWIESWSLVRRYLILAILGRMDYKGAFRDPVDENKHAGNVVQVPWAPSPGPTPMPADAVTAAITTSPIFSPPTGLQATAATDAGPHHRFRRTRRAGAFAKRALTPWNW